MVYPGLRSEIRLPAFKQRLVPYLHGQVTWVAADVTTRKLDGVGHLVALEAPELLAATLLDFLRRLD